MFDLSLRFLMYLSATMLCCHLFLLLSLISSGLAFGQEPKLIAKLDTSASFVTVDNLDNTFILTTKNELLNYSPAGKLLWRYSDKTLGRPDRVDVTDPMRILLFYPGFQQIVVLNNNLSQISGYRFTDTNRHVSLAASANTNGYWYFDQANAELCKLGNDFKDLQQSGNLFQITGKQLQPDMLIANNRFLYLHDPTHGLLQFDRFGGYLKTILTDSLSYFQVKDTVVLYQKGTTLIRLDTQTNQSAEFPLPLHPDLRQVSIGNKVLALLAGKSVYLYSAGIPQH